MTGQLPNRFIFIRHGRYGGSGLPRAEQRRKPLLPRGIEQARAAGCWLADRGIRPDLVVTTKTRRTIQTANLILEELRTPGLERIEAPGGYKSAKEVEKRLREWVGDRQLDTLLFVGHRPNQGQLLKLTQAKALGLDKESHACVIVCERGDDGWRVIDHHPGG